MSTPRVSLSSQMLATRIKKFDTYELRPRSMHRATKLPDTASTTPTTSELDTGWHTFSPSQNDISLKKKEVVTGQVHKKGSYGHLSQTQYLALQAVAVSPAYDVLDEQFVFEHKPVKKRRGKSQKIFYAVGATVFLFAFFVSAQTFITNLQTKEKLGVLGDSTQSKDAQGVVEGTGKDPAEGEVSANAITNYRVDPELPRYLRIPDLKVFARIKHTGVDRNGAVDAPWNINDVSWYNESARPGNSIGSSLLLGHVSGWTAPGVFKNLSKLKAGMRFEIEKGSGEKLTYEVTRGEQIPVNQLDMSKILGSEVAGEHDIKLMTCSGKFNKQTDSYEDRYVIYAKILK